MNRRDFLKLSWLLISMHPLLPKNLWAKEMSVVAVAEGRDYGTITRMAINALGGMGRFVKAGNVVAVKPNMGLG